ncbi:hypothetical protein J7F03_19365 [Streptomyces sp. ISL-43]|uniref:lipase family protein n=1 Tax=Streptomyces sp. ISL-43 TaxID=2819183 RepID=UPI001BE7FC79|nr:lipase family protein [Streptomyces sp. ISL-43]MBT2449214.1 hypothetical protein [Streptomyces sp. ISL-43]
MSPQPRTRRPHRAARNRPAQVRACIRRRRTAAAYAKEIVLDARTEPPPRHHANGSAPAEYPVGPAERTRQAESGVGPGVPLGRQVRHPYLNGKSAAYATLDILRAAHGIDPGAGATALVYGGSQGGHAALWTAHYADEYAPDVDLKGVVANAPAVGFEWMPALFAQQNAMATPYAGMLLLINGASAADPAVKPAELLTPDALAAADRVWTESCIVGDTVLPPAEDILRPGVDLGPLNAALKGSAGNEVTTKVPVLLPQGGNDVLSSLNQALARQLCDKGVNLEFKYYADQGHTISDDPLDDAIALMDARRFGTPVAASCVF